MNLKLAGSDDRKDVNTGIQVMLSEYIQCCSVNENRTKKTKRVDYTTPELSPQNGGAVQYPNAEHIARCFVKIVKVLYRICHTQRRLLRHI